MGLVRLAALLLAVVCCCPSSGGGASSPWPGPGQQHNREEDDHAPIKPVAAHGNTPVMGWSTWYAFGGNLSEAKVLTVADLMVSTGLVDAGYEYLNLDDAWLAPMRDRFGRMQADPGRFPSGMKSLATKLGARGIRLGLYGDPGIRTCMGCEYTARRPCGPPAGPLLLLHDIVAKIGRAFCPLHYSPAARISHCSGTAADPGQFEHEYDDAQTLAEWGVQFWKYDQCWHKIPLIDILAREAYSQELPASASISNGNALGMNVRGMSAVGQDANFAGGRIFNFTSAERGFVGPQIKIGALPAAWEVAETWSGQATDGGIPGTQIQYYEAYRLFGEALAATGKNITYSICPFIAGCDKSIWSYYAGVAHMSMNQCPEHDATDNWASFLCETHESSAACFVIDLSHSQLLIDEHAEHSLLQLPPPSSHTTVVIVRLI